MTLPPIHQPPTPYYSFASPEPAPPKTARRILIIGAVAIGLLAALAIGLALWPKNSGKPKAFELTGTVALTGSIAGYSSGTDFECQGKGGYSDIGPNTAVTVADETGTLIAKGRLISSIGDSTFCGFIFSVPDVPTGKTYYQVEVSHRGVLSFTEEEAADGLSLSLGN